MKNDKLWRVFVNNYLIIFQEFLLKIFIMTYTIRYIYKYVPPLWFKLKALRMKRYLWDDKPHPCMIRTSARIGRSSVNSSMNLDGDLFKTLFICGFSVKLYCGFLATETKKNATNFISFCSLVHVKNRSLQSNDIHSKKHFNQW